MCFFAKKLSTHYNLNYEFTNYTNYYNRTPILLAKSVLLFFREFINLLSHLVSRLIGLLTKYKPAKITKQANACGNVITSPRTR